MPADEAEVFEIVRNVYGLNSAPRAWHNTLREALLEAGWSQSALDPCLYILRQAGRTVGACIVYVDDLALAGHGAAFDHSVKMLKSRFDFRKWRVGSGTFVGSTVTQHKDYSIELHQEGFVRNLNPIRVSPKAMNSALASPQQIHEARTLMGGLQWLASQTRPDIGAQVSLAQQAFPSPTVKDLRMMNQALRRARQFDGFGLRLLPLDADRVGFCLHTDASLANGKRKRT